MKKIIISLFIIGIMSVAANAEPTISRVGINAPARLPSYSAPISTSGFTTSFVKVSNLRVPNTYRPNKIQPINTGGFTTAFPKETVSGQYMPDKNYTPIIERQPRHYNIIYDSAGNKKVYRNNSTKTATTCYGITYYDRNGNVSRCN